MTLTARDADGNQETGGGLRWHSAWEAARRRHLQRRHGQRQRDLYGHVYGNRRGQKHDHRHDRRPGRHLEVARGDGNRSRQGLAAQDAGADGVLADSDGGTGDTGSEKRLSASIPGCSMRGRRRARASCRRRRVHWHKFRGSRPQPCRQRCGIGSRSGIVVGKLTDELALKDAAKGLAERLAFLP